MTSEPDINKILAHAAIEGFDRLSTNSLNRIKRAWTQQKHRPGFTPLPEESDLLYDISRSAAYQSFKHCVGSKYTYNRYIKVGLLLQELSLQGYRDRLRAIRDELRQKKHPKGAFKLIHIASTGVLSQVLEYLSSLRDQYKLSKQAVRREFELIVEQWTKISISVSNRDVQRDLLARIVRVISRSPPAFFVYASRGAIQKAQELMAKVNNDGMLTGKYILWSKTTKNHDHSQYLCACYNINYGIESPFTS